MCMMARCGPMQNTKTITSAAMDAINGINTTIRGAERRKVQDHPVCAHAGTGTKTTLNCV